MKLVYPVITSIVVVIFLLSVPIVTSSKEDFSSYNTAWNGYSGARDLTAQQRYPESAIASLGELANKDRGVVVLANPNNTVAITQDDITNTKDFVANGGSLFLSNDFGNANALLDGLGLAPSVRFNGSLLRDNVDNWADSAYPLVTTFAASDITAGIRTVDFNYGTTLDINATHDVPITVLAWSGPTSYSDSAAPNSAAPQSSTNQTVAKPVLVYLTYGKGKIVLFSDPSVFINDMLGRDDNERLYTNIIANLSRTDHTAPVIFAESQRAQQPLFSVAYSELNASDVTKYTFILAAVALFTVGITARNALKRTEHRTRPDGTPETVTLNEEAVTNDLIERHPQWSRVQLKKILYAIKAHEKRR